MSDMRKMQLGHIVDYCIDYNKRQERAEKAEKRAERRGNRRKASQNDINSFFG